MSHTTEPLDVEGRETVIQWFDGEWPCFHDAEIVSLTLSRKGESLLCVYPYSPAKPATVEFYLDEVSDLDLTDFSQQNVISGLEVERVTDQTDKTALRIRLGGCYGLSGWIDAKKVRVQLLPGKSSDGVSLW
jgi:hypothetical protein